MGRAAWILALPVLVVVSEAVESEVDQLQQTVDSDKQNVEKAVHDMEHVAAKFRYAARNDTHAIALAKNLAEEARTDAAQAASQGKKQAMHDFVISLSALRNLKTSNSSKMKDAANNARQKSEHLDKLQEEEQKDARERLRKHRNAQRDEVRQSYREAHELTRKLLRDRNRLMNAQRRAGEKENMYEREEDRNENFAEHNQDRSEDQLDKAYGAIESIFDRAEDYLGDKGQKDREKARHARGHAIQTAFETLRKVATEEKEEASLPAAINLMEQPMEEPMELAAKSKSLGSLEAALKNMQSSANQEQLSEKGRAHYSHDAKARTETEKEAQNVVDSDRDEMMHAIHNMEQASTLITNAAKNQTKAKSLAISLVEEAQSQAHHAMEDKTMAAMHDFEHSLSAIKGASSQSDVERLRKVARQKSETLNKLKDEEDRDAQERLNKKRDAQRDEVRRSYQRAHEAASHMLTDGNRLENAQRRSGEKESVYEGQQLRNEMFAERSGDNAQDHQEQARDAVENIYERAQDYFQSSSRKNSEAAERTRQRAMESAVASATTALRQASKEQADGTELLAQPVVGLSLFAAASLGLLAFFVVRQARPAPKVALMLGQWKNHPLLG